MIVPVCHHSANSGCYHLLKATTKYETQLQQFSEIVISELHHAAYPYL